MYSIGPKHIVVPAPKTNLEVNGNLEDTFAAGSTIEVNITDGVNPVTPNDVTVVGDVVTIEVPAATAAPVGATLMKTGQTTSYRTGDDGDLEEGRATDFFTLASNNPFGNTNRFTDELGGSTYTNNIVIDWSAYNGATVLGYRRTLNGTLSTWNSAIDNSQLVSIGTFTSGWRLPNIREIQNLQNWSLTQTYNYAPFNLVLTDALWSSTTPSVGGGAFAICITSNYTSTIIQKVNSNNYQWLPVRTFTVTGTTLT
jgi:hypothetical protein